MTGHQGTSGDSDGEDAGGADIRPGRRGRRTPRVVGGVLAGLLVLGAGAAAWAYLRLDGNIRGIDIDQALGDDR